MGVNQVIEAWADRNRTPAKSGNVRHEYIILLGARFLYSYSTVIGVRLDTPFDGVHFYITSDRHSITTSRHTNKAKSAGWPYKLIEQEHLNKMERSNSREEMLSYLAVLADMKKEEGKWA